MELTGYPQLTTFARFVLSGLLQEGEIAAFRHGVCECVPGKPSEAGQPTRLRVESHNDRKYNPPQLATLSACSQSMHQTLSPHSAVMGLLEKPPAYEEHEPNNLRLGMC